jgi:hypothetical protein
VLAAACWQQLLSAGCVFTANCYLVPQAAAKLQIGKQAGAGVDVVLRPLYNVRRASARAGQQ